jgi:hypothetical protein
MNDDVQKEQERSEKTLLILLQNKIYSLFMELRSPKAYRIRTGIIITVIIFLPRCLRKSII